MKLTKEFQPYINKEMNQPRTCIWLEPENIDEYKQLKLLESAIVNNDKVIAGFTGSDSVLLIQFPL